MKVADVEAGDYILIPFTVRASLPPNRTPRVEGWHQVQVIEVRSHGRLFIEEAHWIWDKPTPFELEVYGGHSGWLLGCASKRVVYSPLQYEVASRSCRPCLCATVSVA